MLSSCTVLRLFEEVKPQAGDWLQLGGNPQHTGYTSQEIIPPLKIHWEYAATAAIPTASPTVVGGKLFIHCRNGDVAVLNPADAKEIAQGGVSYSMEGAPVADGKYLFAFDAFARQPLITYDLSQGYITGEKRSGVGFEASPLVVGEGMKRRIYAANLQGELVCIDRYGAPQFLFKTEERLEAVKVKPASAPVASTQIHSSPALLGRTVIFGNDAGVLYGVDSETGKQTFRISLGNESIYAAVCMDTAEQAAFITTADVGRSRSTGGAVIKVSLKDIANPVIEKRIPLPATLFGAAALSPEGFVLAGASDHKLRCFNKRTMELVWAFESKASFNAAPLIAGKYVFAGSLDRRLYVLELATGKLVQRLKLSGRIKTPPIAVGNRIIVCAENNMVYSLTHDPAPDTTKESLDDDDAEF